MTLRKDELPGAYRPPPPPPSDETSLNVALYKFVPSLDAFVSAVRFAWQQRHPEVTLNFFDYSPYEGPPPPTLDVFPLDCIYADDLAAAGQLDPISASEIWSYDDLMQPACDNAMLDPAAYTFAGIPYLLCTAVLYYRDDDPRLGDPGPLGIDDLASIFGPARYPGPQPPPKTGLMIDLSGKTTDACLYASMWRQAHDVWWPRPLRMGEPEAGVLGELRNYVVMAGRAQASHRDTSGHDRTDWFAAGYGRALVGLTETMYAWDPGTLSHLRFRPFPIAASGDPDRLMMYADAMALRPGLGDRRAVALELANVIASAEVGVAAMFPSGTGAQYLIPARTSVLEQLEEALPLYGAIARLLESFGSTTPFRFGKGARDWVPRAGQKILSVLFPPTEEEVAAEPVEPTRRRRGYEHTPAGMWRREG